MYIIQFDYKKLLETQAIEPAMTIYTKSYEKRHHVRHQLKENIFVDIQGNLFDGFASVTDISKGGLGFKSACKVRKLEGKRILIDLFFDKNKAIIRSLLSQIVFSYDTTHDNKGITEISGRYGVQFVDLSDLDKRLLDLISEKYTLSDYKKNMSKKLSSSSYPN